MATPALETLVISVMSLPFQPVGPYRHFNEGSHSHSLKGQMCTKATLPSQDGTFVISVIFLICPEVDCVVYMPHDVINTLL